MSSVEYDTACYHADLRDADPDEMFECPCGQEVRLDEVKTVRMWSSEVGWTYEDACPDCAKEGE
jgi:hypothetical protein